MSDWTPGLKKTRKTVWLTVNGEVNTLRTHFIKAGYRAGYPSTVSHRTGKKQSDITITEWREYLGPTARFAEKPANWRELIYSNALNQEPRKSKPLTAIEDLRLRFATMRLSANPLGVVQTYY